jgi:hypothetical protein
MNAPALYGEGAAEISKTLANGYDPETSAYYQAYRNQRLEENQQQKDRFSEDAAGQKLTISGTNYQAPTVT